MSNVIEFPFNKLHPQLREHPLCAQMYEALGARDFNMLMEMWSAQLYGKFDEWYDRYIGVGDHIQTCMEIADFANEYAALIIENMMEGDDETVH